FALRHAAHQPDVGSIVGVVLLSQMHGTGNGNGGTGRKGRNNFAKTGEHPAPDPVSGELGGVPARVPKLPPRQTPALATCTGRPARRRPKVGSPSPPPAARRSLQPIPSCHHQDCCPRRKRARSPSAGWVRATRPAWG